MTVREISWLRDASSLIFYYKRSGALRAQVDSTYSFNNRSVFFYIETLIRFSPNYFRYYREIFQRDLGYFANRRVRQIWKDILPTRLWSFFDRCERDKGEFTRVLQTISGATPSPSIYTQEELARLSQLDNLPQDQPRIDALDSLLQQITRAKNIITAQKEQKEESPYEWFVKELEKKPPFLTPKEQLARLQQKPRFVPLKTTLSKAGIALRSLATPMRVTTVLSGGAGAAIGGSIAGQAGAFFGGITGAILPTVVKTEGGLNILGKVGNTGLNFGTNLLSAINTISNIVPQVRVAKIVLIVALILAGLIIVLGMGFLESSSLVPPFQPIAGVAPGASPLPPGAGGQIASCLFTRAGVSKPIKANRLVVIFEEVATKSGIPASVLASLAMHESAQFTANADDSHDAFRNVGFTGPECQPHFPTSSTGALGLMQVQPPTTILPKAHPGAYSVDGLRRGAQLAGKTYESLTMQDFCDIRTNVYLGAGVLISKNGGKPPTTGDEVKSSVCSYYGQCQYGPYNYGEEAKRDFENCKPALAGPIAPGPIGFSVSCPVETPRITCGTAANPINNCGHGGLGYPAVCDPNYYVCNGTRYSDALYKSIDVKTNISGQIVRLPYINGNEIVEWTKTIPLPIPIGPIDPNTKKPAWGYKLTYQVEYGGKRLLLDLTHIDTPVGLNTSKSGEQVATIFPKIGHLHTALAVNGVWIEPVKDANMCSN